MFFVCLTPILDPLASVYSLAFSNTNASTIDDTGADNVYKGPSGVHSGFINYDEFEFPKYGSIFGNISIEGTQINCPLVYGDETAELKKGACVSMFGNIPGCSKGILVGAHNNTYFHTLPDAQIGATVTVETTYGSYTYKVYNAFVMNANDRKAYVNELNGDKEILILYTCYPVNTLASTPDRYMVFCEFVSGPQVNLYEGREQ